MNEERIHGVVNESICTVREDDTSDGGISLTFTFTTRRGKAVGVCIINADDYTTKPTYLLRGSWQANEMFTQAIDERVFRIRHSGIHLD